MLCVNMQEGGRQWCAYSFLEYVCVYLCRCVLCEREIEREGSACVYIYGDLRKGDAVRGRERERERERERGKET